MISVILFSLFFNYKCHNIIAKFVLLQKRSCMLVLYVIILLFGESSYAHPVTFKGGQEISFSDTPLMSKLNYHYSFTAKDSLGFSILKMENSYYLGEYNHLLIRKNTRESQSNIYLGFLAGLNNNGILSLGGNIEVDAETRRFYSMGKLTVVDNESMVMAKIGVAPILASYNEVQPWILLQYQRSGERNNIGPVLRVMYSNYLGEISFIDNKVYGSLMIHF